MKKYFDEKMFPPKKTHHNNRTIKKEPIFNNENRIIGNQNKNNGIRKLSTAIIECNQPKTNTVKLV